MSGEPVVTEYDASGNLISPFYGYLPTMYVCYIFIVLFGISTVLHFGCAIWYRAWWLLPTVVLAGSGECLGWAGRLWSSYRPLTDTPYLIQIVATIIAPTPLVGAVFIVFGRLSARLGQQYGRLSPSLYSKIFVTCDIVSLLIQSVGGGIAASTDDKKLSDLGSNIMLGGIVFQLISLSVFCILAAEYFWRYIRGKPSRRLLVNRNSTDTIVSDFAEHHIGMPLRKLLAGVSFTTLVLFVRAIYRTIELADGFNGHIIQTQVYFNVFDGAMVVLAMYTLNIFHPARLLKAADSQPASIPLKNTISSA